MDLLRSLPITSICSAAMKAVVPRNRRGGPRHPRYAFANVSTDVTGIFCSACDCLGLRWTSAFPKSEPAAVSIYVSRKADVARLDEMVGPKR
jgi:hypothetical protein